MALTATGPLTIPLDALRTAISNSATFQTRTNSADATEALHHIFYDLVESFDGETIAYKRPFAIIDYETLSSPLVATGPTYDTDGTFIVLVSDDANNDDQHAESYRDFDNFVGGLSTDLMSPVRTADYLEFSAITYTQKPVRTPRRERTLESAHDYWVAILELKYGSIET